MRGVAAVGEAFLRQAPYTEARDALLALHGVSPFSAGAILLRGRGRMDELPWGDAFDRVAHALYGRQVDHHAIAARNGRAISYWAFTCARASRASLRARLGQGLRREMAS